MLSLFKRIPVLIGVILSMISMAAFAQSSKLNKDFMQLEHAFNGKLGIYAINTANNMTLQHRANEYFPFQSTVKVIVVADILKKSMTDPHLLQEKIYYSHQKLYYWSPITEKHVAEGMTVEELCKAAIMYSDNTAANLLIAKLGGPQAVTDFAHSIGNKVFQLNYIETLLNSVGGIREDSSTPKAMALTLQKLTLGSVLAAPQRNLLVTWMKGNTTGEKRIRASVPKGWAVADKTGSGDYGVTNDIAVIWPPHCAPLVITIYFVRSKQDDLKQEAALASATRLVITTFSQFDECFKKI